MGGFGNMAVSNAFGSNTFNSMFISVYYCCATVRLCFVQVAWYYVLNIICFVHFILDCTGLYFLKYLFIVCLPCKSRRVRFFGIVSLLKTKYIYIKIYYVRKKIVIMD